MVSKNFVKICFAGLSFVLSLFLFTEYAFGATVLTTIFDQLDRAKQNQTTGVGQIIAFTPTTTDSTGTNSIIRLQFPDADDTQWCRTVGALTATTSTYQSATGLPGTLTANCTQGSGSTSYDTIYICATGTNTWTAGTLYGVRVVDSTGHLGTRTTAANDNKVIVTVGYAATCTDPTTITDTGYYALSVVANDQVAVTATVDPLFSFSITNLTIGFGEFPSTTKRWATTDTNGLTSEPGNQNPSYFTVSTNAPNGAMVAAASTGNGTAGLYKSIAPTKLIPAAAANSVTTGTEGYGLYVKNVGSSLAAVSGWLNSGATGVISSTLQSIVTASGPVSSNNTADIALVAAIATSTPAGAYSDAITLVGTGKF